MKIKAYETKFSVEDVVWFMYENKPSRGIVYKVVYEQTEEADLSWTEICLNIVNRVRSYFDLHKQEQNVSYRIQKIREDGSYYGVGAGISYHTAATIFHTKEELLKSL